MRGKVLLFNNVKGLGFIRGEDEEKYFVHESKIRMEGFRALLPDMEVEFELGTGWDGRPQAWNVRPIAGAMSAILDPVAKTVNIEKGGVIPLMVPGVMIPNAAANVSGDGLLAYRVSGKVNAFRFELPGSSKGRVFLVLDAASKTPVVLTDPQYTAPVGSYLMVADADGQMTVWSLGRRHQVSESGKNMNWAVVERRFSHRYDFGPGAASIEEQTPTSGDLKLKRDNDGFDLAMEVARQYMREEG